ncbi:nitronate monooxygenase [Xylophilus sp. Kf1]|nr:nitronate monooxygenase [Xylophilus sp. Kf1]
MQPTDASRQLTRRLNIRHPIVQAPMAGSSTPRMAAAVCEAGGLGSLGIGALRPAAAREAIAAFRALSAGPLNVNLFCHRPARVDPARSTGWLQALRPAFEALRLPLPDGLTEIYRSFVEDDEMLAMLLDLRPEVVSFHFGLPPAAVIARLKQAGVLLMGSATSLEEALMLEAAGIDAIVAQGIEAGGHRGMFDPQARDEAYPTSVLVRLLVARLRTPVVAAGGLMTGADIAAALRDGAAAAQLGTAFLATGESAADAHHRRLLLDPDSARHTVMTAAISGRPARCLANRFTAFGLTVDPARIADYPLAYDAGKALHQGALKVGESGYGAYWAGQGAPFTRAMDAGALMQALVEELAAA